MTCHEFWDEMPELAAGDAVPEHAQKCPACATLLQRQRTLASGLSRMAQQSGPREAPKDVETRLLKAFRAQAGVRPKAARRYWWVGVAAAAVLAALILWTAGRPVKPAGPPVPTDLIADFTDFDSDFIPLPYGSADPGNAVVPDEGTDLVRVEVPRTALIALGLPVSEDGSTRVQAEVALAADGTLQGIRIVQ